MRRLLGFFVCSWLAVACSEQKDASGLMVVMRTDLKVPQIVDSVGVYIQRIEGSRVTLVQALEVKSEVGPGGERNVHLPGTLAIENLGDPDIRVRVRIVAYNDKGASLAMRESRVKVPTDRIAALPMPLLWMNTDDVADSDPAAGGPTPVVSQAMGGIGLLQDAPAGRALDAFGRLRSDFCGPERTLDDTGACREIDVDVDGLQEFDGSPEQLSGLRDREEEASGAPGSDNGVGGARSRGFCREPAQSKCFDLTRCFARDDDPNFAPVQVPVESIQGLDGPGCFVALEAVPSITIDKVSIAVQTKDGEGAVCTQSGACYIGIDTTMGGRLDVAGKRYELPPGVCRKAKKGSVLSVVVSPLCDAKLPDEPVCVDSTGVATAGDCLDGSGWDGELDPPPTDTDGGTDGGLPCASIAKGTGFWVGQNRITVAGGNTFTRFDLADAAENCVRGTGESLVESAAASDVPYRLLGSTLPEWDANVAFMSHAPSSASTAGLSGALHLSFTPPATFGSAFGGAFFDATTGGTRGAVAAFVAHSNGSVGGSAHTVGFTFFDTAGRSTTETLTTAEQNIGTPTNVVAAAGTSALLQAVSSNGKIKLMHCVGTTCNFMEAPSEYETATPIYLGMGSDGSGYLLASRPSGAVILGVRGDAPAGYDFDVDRMWPLPDNEAVPAEMTLTVAGSASAPRIYVATKTRLWRLREGIADVVEGPLDGLFHAVQARGDRLYWLESNQAGDATVRYRTLDAAGDY